MWNSLPLFGSAALLAVMLAAAYTFSVSLVAGANGKPRTLQAARLGAYGTVTLVGVAVLAPSYAFVTHDFRMRYVAAHSDRSMPTAYLLTALWGGQDGSILWWLFLLGVYIGRVREVAGEACSSSCSCAIIATLMVVRPLLLRRDDRSRLNRSPARWGAGGIRGVLRGWGRMNPLLQNYWMIIHPLASTRASSAARCRLPSRSRRSSPGGSTMSGFSPAGSGPSSPGCSSPSATRSARCGPTSRSAGAGTGGGTRSRTRRSCRS